MRKTAFLLAGLFLLESVPAWAAQGCSQKMAGKQLCIAGMSMVCSKEFNVKSKKFDYVLNGINADGQSFSIDSPLYRKTTGYTPVSCIETHATH